MNHINPGIASATTMAYDMVTEHDNNISTEIKSILIDNLGWHENIPQITVKQMGLQDTLEYGTSMPASTLWKVNIGPEEAIQDFLLACNVYNTSHSNDNPPKIAKGKAFAIKDILYDAVEIR